MLMITAILTFRIRAEKIERTNFHDSGTSKIVMKQTKSAMNSSHIMMMTSIVNFT